VPALFETLIRGDERIITITGAGGKTSLMFALARAFQKRGTRVITTTTTRILRPGPEQSSHVLLCSENDSITAPLAALLARNGHVTLAGRALPGDKLEGLPCRALEKILADSPADLMIIEGDGARNLPLKVPGENEPVVPQATDLFIGMAGLDCIGSRLCEETAFRPELIAALAGQQMGEPITAATIARLAVHPQGMLKGCPPGARSCIFLNKIDTTGGMEKARQVIAAASAMQAVLRPDTWLAGIVRDKECFMLERAGE
jgi:probable selenium-dependent hydroxylase accessory protein YqeC